MTRIAVVGDAMVDFDVYLEHRRTTLEGLPVYVDNQSTEERPGGASNVARMIEALGNDVMRINCGESVKKRFFIDERVTFRIDLDSIKSPSPDDLSKWYRLLMQFGPTMFVICDHGKGCITRESLKLIDQFNQPIIYDPCMSTDWNAVESLKNLLCVSGNRHEWGDRYDSFDKGKFKIRRLDADGVEWCDMRYESGGRWKLPSFCKKPIDTVGAGDQFAAVLAWKLDANACLDYSIRYANIAAGLQCQKQGIQPLANEFGGDLHRGIEKWLPVVPEKF